MNANGYDRRPIKVYADCTLDWIDEATVEIENLAEDIQGRDLLTFRCPLCQQSHTSLRIG